MRWARRGRAMESNAQGVRDKILVVSEEWVKSKDDTDTKRLRGAVHDLTRSAAAYDTRKTTDTQRKEGTQTDQRDQK